jgi:hypothetical protein
MSINSKLALVAVLTSLAAPAFAADQQGSLEALDRYAPAQITTINGAYASVDRAPRGNQVAQPEAAQSDFQATGSH